MVLDTAGNNVLEGPRPGKLCNKWQRTCMKGVKVVKTVFLLCTAADGPTGMIFGDLNCRTGL